MKTFNGENVSSAIARNAIDDDNGRFCYSFQTNACPTKAALLANKRMLLAPENVSGKPMSKLFSGTPASMSDTTQRNEKGMTPMWLSQTLRVQPMFFG